ncbi:signal peptidase II [Candidatus Woesearchaeota archaeon]|nr:signal peptidase II [Candidatus Woesearchaeota archaeon]
MQDIHNHPTVEKHKITTKQYLILFAIIAIVFILDQLSKFIITQMMQLNESLFFTSFFSLTYITNTGSSFGSLQGYNQLLIWITIIVIGFILYYLPYFEQQIFPALGLVIGGALGNLIDRIRIGAVIDFIDFKVWPVFNIADSAITIAAIMIVVLTFFWKPAK